MKAGLLCIAFGILMLLSPKNKNAWKMGKHEFSSEKSYKILCVFSGLLIIIIGILLLIVNT